MGTSEDASSGSNQIATMVSLVAPPFARPEVFISYAWEGEPHPTWVKELATRMRKEDGLDVKLDVWAAQPGDELTRFMESAVRDGSFVLLICTPTYKVRFDKRLGGVGYEAKNITGLILTGLARRKVIPIHRSGTWAEAAPTVVAGDFYVSLMGDPYSEAAYRSLVDVLHGRREMAPAIGLRATVFEGPGAAPARAVPNFSGRDSEFQSVIDHLQASADSAVCVVVAGIGGVGKTALVRQLVATVAPRLFPEGAAWLNGVDLISELARVCRRFGWGIKDDPTPEQATRFLANELHDQRLLLVIDGVPAGTAYAHVPIPGGKCRTLVTSRFVSLAQDLGAPTATVRLDHWRPEASRQYLRDVVPRLMAEPDADLDGVSNFVQGLPLAIRLIARGLLKTPSRSARQHLAFLKSQPLTTLDQFAAGADRGVATTFLEAYGSLAPYEQKVLGALASCAQGTQTAIVAVVAGMDLSRAEEALNTLAGVSLAECREGAAAPWGLHDVLRIFVSAQPGYDGFEVTHQAWVREYLLQPTGRVPHVTVEAAVAEAIASFERLLAASQIGLASDVLNVVFEHLMRHGHYVRAVYLAERLLANLKEKDERHTAVWLDNLGNCYQAVDDFPTAIGFHERALPIWEKLGDLQGAASSLGSLGGSHLMLGDVSMAIDFLQRSISIGEKLGVPQGQARALGNLGLCYLKLCDVPEAIDSFRRSLSIDETLGSLDGQARSLSNLGRCYELQGDIDLAIDFHERSLVIYEKLGNIRGQASELVQLSGWYEVRGESSKAKDCGQRSFALFLRGIGID